MKMPEPTAWTLTEELSKRETTTRAHLWFTNPVNCMWSPLYDKQALIDLLEEAAKECEADHAQAHTYDADGLSIGHHSDALTCAAAIRKLKETL